MVRTSNLISEIVMNLPFAGRLGEDLDGRRGFHNETQL